MSGGVFIVPYRNRESHLYKFISHYSSVAPDIPVYVIEQADDKPFNRGKLFNSAVLELDFDYYIFHDVDYWIDETMCDPLEMFAFPETPIHLATYAQSFNWGVKEKKKWSESYAIFFGGVCMMSRKDILNSGGWTNEFWSWSPEDDECRNNLIKKGFEVNRRPAYFKCEDHPREVKPDLFKKNIQRMQQGRDDNSDGIHHCKYEVLERTRFDHYTQIAVRL